FAIGLARGDQRQRLRRVRGGDEPYLARRIVAGRNKDQRAIVRPADADGEPELLRLLVQRDRVGGRRSEPVIARAIAAPVVVDLGEHDSGAVAGPYRLADADFGDGLDVLARRDIADTQLEALRPVVVDQRRE